MPDAPIAKFRMKLSRTLLRHVRRVSCCIRTRDTFCPQCGVHFHPARNFAMDAMRP